MKELSKRVMEKQKRRFNKMGVLDIDLTGWTDETICHWAMLNKDPKTGELKLMAEFRVALYDQEGNCYTGVVETELETQGDKDNETD